MCIFPVCLPQAITTPWIDLSIKRKESWTKGWTFKPVIQARFYQGEEKPKKMTFTDAATLCNGGKKLQAEVTCVKMVLQKWPFTHLHGFIMELNDLFLRRSTRHTSEAMSLRHSRSTCSLTWSVRASSLEKLSALQHCQVLVPHGLCKRARLLTHGFNWGREQLLLRLVSDFSTIETHYKLMKELIDLFSSKRRKFAT